MLKTQSRDTLFTKANVLLAVSAFTGFSATSAPAQTPSQVQKALDNARKGNNADIYSIHETFGDKALSSFAEARFDKDPKVRNAALEIAGHSYESVLFVLPLIEDSSFEIARGAILHTANGYKPRAKIQEIRAEQVVPHLAVALKNHSNLAASTPEIMLLLAQFKRDPAARTLLRRILQKNGWDNFFQQQTPVEWDQNAVVALLAQCEIGAVSADQVQAVLQSDAKARSYLVAYTNFLTNKQMLRYTLSLLNDTTVYSPPDEEFSGGQISSDARSAFKLLTGINIKYTEVDGVRRYDKEDIARLYAYYGLTEK